MSPALAADLKRAAGLLAIALVAGLLSGHLLAALVIALALLAGWQLRELWRMHRWLHGAGARPRPRIGLLSDIESRLERLQRQARKRKKRLRKVALRFQQAAEASPDGAVILSESGAIEWLNAAASRLLGLRQGRDHGQLVGNLLRQPDFSNWMERDDASETYEMDAPAGDRQRLLLRMVPYGDNKRMLVVRDITRLHTLEQMRRDFVANVSHELRSPLTVLVGYLEGMGDDETLPEHLRRPVALMAQQSARMSRIVEDLLRLSRIERDPGAAPRNPIAVRDLIQTILRDAASLRPVDHDMQVDVAEGVLLLGDYNEIYSAFSNLVFNAVQYTPPGGVIRIGWQRGEHGARFEVADTGVGIEAEHLPRLTERFYRVDKARSRELGGTGLGLAIVKHVLMRHDATLQVQSEPGAGSTFACEFPPTRIELAAPALAAAPDQGAARASSA